MSKVQNVERTKLRKKKIERKLILLGRIIHYVPNVVQRIFYRPQYEKISGKQFQISVCRWLLSTFCPFRRYGIRRISEGILTKYEQQYGKQQYGWGKFMLFLSSKFEWKTANLYRTALFFTSIFQTNTLTTDHKHILQPQHTFFSQSTL